MAAGGVSGGAAAGGVAAGGVAAGGVAAGSFPNNGSADFAGRQAGQVRSAAGGVLPQAEWPAIAAAGVASAGRGRPSAVHSAEPQSLFPSVLSPVPPSLRLALSEQASVIAAVLSTA